MSPFSPLRLRSLLFAVLVATGCQGPDGTQASEAIVRDSAGVRIVESPQADRPAPRSPVRLAGLHAPDSALSAVPWGVAADPASGRIYVADQMGTRVVAFDAAGAHVGTFGGAGDGPGEFRNPTAVALGPGPELVVWDAFRAVLSRWSPEGTFLDEEPAPLDYWGPGAHVFDAGVAAVTLEPAEGEQRQHLVQAVAGDTTVLHTVSRELVMMELPCMSQPTSRLFAPDVVWAGAGERVHVLHGPDYRIDTYRDGVLASSLRRDVQPIRVTAEGAGERVRFGQYAALLRTCGVTAEEVVDAIGFEELISPVQWIAVDPEGRLWVTRSDDGITPDRVDILDLDAGYDATFEAPGIVVGFPSPSRFVAFTLDEATGETLLGVYEMRATAPAGAGETPVGTTTLRGDSP